MGESRFSVSFHGKSNATIDQNIYPFCLEQTAVGTISFQKWIEFALLKRTDGYIGLTINSIEISSQGTWYRGNGTHKS
eukprot:snap_masked-scaffold_3-processed-gene-20.25-mRNA-1 protein AED:1.00 eAED:1.00 QI:0/-1/0/0/-1/1/1/0/77